MCLLDASQEYGQTQLGFMTLFIVMREVDTPPDLNNARMPHTLQVAVPIEDEALQRQLRDVLALCLYDGVDAWDMTPAGWAPLTRTPMCQTHV